MPKITNKNYRRFFDEGIITTLTEDNIRTALGNVHGKHSREGKALILILYYTGARPNEVLNLRGKDVVKDDNYIVIRMKGSKGGLPRPIYLPYKNELVREIHKYSIGVFPDMLLFYNFRSENQRYITWKLQSGEIRGKEYIESTHKLRYHFKKWFESVIDGSITPYFLRHNKFSTLAEKGVSMGDIMNLKGAKTLASVKPYTHMSTKAAKALAKYA